MRALFRVNLMKLACSCKRKWTSVVIKFILENVTHAASWRFFGKCLKQWDYQQRKCHIGHNELQGINMKTKHSHKKITVGKAELSCPYIFCFYFNTKIIQLFIYLGKINKLFFGFLLKQMNFCPISPHNTFIVASQVASVALVFLFLFVFASSTELVLKMD